MLARYHEILVYKSTSFNYMLVYVTLDVNDIVVKFSGSISQKGFLGVETTKELLNDKYTKSWKKIC